MRRRRRITYREEKETKKLIFISVSVLGIAILSFVITFVIYSNYLNSKEIKVAEYNKNNITDLSKNNTEIISQTSTSIGKTIKEIENMNLEEKNEKENEENVDKIAINTSNMVKEEKEKKEIIEENKEEIEKEIIVPDPKFIKPVEGEIIREYAKENLIYSNTLGEWITHYGIDIKAEKTTVVKASADGTIKSIKNDPRYGITVVIEHVNGYSSVYSNLLMAEFVKEGEKVKQGQTIGTVGTTAVFEIADEPHLHFEILKDGEYLDPNIYID